MAVSSLSSHRSTSPPTNTSSTSSNSISGQGKGLQICYKFRGVSRSSYFIVDVQLFFLDESWKYCRVSVYTKLHSWLPCCCSAAPCWLSVSQCRPPAAKLLGKANNGTFFFRIKLVSHFEIESLQFGDEWGRWTQNHLKKNFKLSKFWAAASNFATKLAKWEL